MANCRTFGFLKEVEYLRSQNLALGGSLDNAIVIGDEGVMNSEGLRHVDEMVRHKILDFIGDLALSPFPIKGHFEVFCSGHQHNNIFLQHLLDNMNVCCKIEGNSNSVYDKVVMEANKRFAFAL